ncbi:MAG TPA: NAD(P)H-dependent glycerol-3-phosphate dehydrogenase, partial [Nakamurella sp.]
VPETFTGLAGMGDLVVTCTSKHSRNRHVGEQIGKGVPVPEILAGMKQVAEGVKTASVVMKMAADAGVEMPIAREVDAVVNHGSTPERAYRGLLNEAPGHEVHGDSW